MKLRLTITAVVIVAAVLAAAGSAVAAEWHVAGAPLALREKLKENPTVTAAFKLVAGGVTVECKTLKLEDAEIIEKSSFAAEHLVFGKCKVANPAPVCSIKGETITTTELVGTAALGVFPVDTLAITPKTGKLVTTITYEGLECVFEGETPVTGKMTVTLGKGQEELVPQPITVNTPAGELVVGATPATLTGGFEAETKKAEKWSYR
jgi:hypothetical protein